MKARTVLRVLAIALTLGFLPAGTNAGSPAPIVIREQGSFFVGGQTLFTLTANDTSAVSSRNPGTAAINQSYVQFQIPASNKYKLPIILYHGGGHHGKAFESTPDGREGWATYFLRQGFAVYLVDGVNRGRSGYDMTDLALVRQGVEPITSIPQMNRYTYELAWTQFRIGPVLGTPFPTSQFPVEAFAQYANQLVPAWRNTATENPKNIAALVALVDQVCPCILLTWSQSGLFGWKAAVQRPELVKAIVALEPAGISPAGVATGVTPADLAVLATIPILLEVGDFDPTRITSLENFASTIGPHASVLVLPDVGIIGNGHLVFMEKNNLQVADVVIQRLEMMLGKLLK